jgi:DNA polymerase-1
MRDDFARGIDPHRQLAANVHGLGYDAVPEAIRDGVKPISFGSIYGSGGRGLARSAWVNYGIIISPEEATAIRDTFLSRYSTLANWMRSNASLSQGRGYIAAGTLGRVIEEAWEARQEKHRGHYSGPPPDGDGEDADDEFAEWEDDDWLDYIGSGRAGRQPSNLRYTLACNAPIQGSCADVTMLAMSGIDRALSEANIDGGLVLSVHDELVLEVAEERAAKAASLLKQCMVRAFLRIFPKAPTTKLVEIKIGRTWREAKAQKGSV